VKSELVDDLVIVERQREPTEPDIVALNAFSNVMRAEAHPEDPPMPLEMTRADALNVPEFIGFKEFWARENNGAIAALGFAWWRNTDENRHLCWIGIEVRPDRRRCGLARAFLPMLIGVADAQGRTLFMGSTSDRVPAGEAFARRVGAEPGSAVHTNRLLLTDVDREMTRSWVADGPVRGKGYSLVAVDGRYPEDLIEQVAAVYGVMNTAPRDDLDMEDVTFTPEHLREWEKTREAAGTIRWSLFARHEASGELIGLTEVYWNPHEPKTVYQGDTGVHPDHRGHALGKWMKAAMLERVLEARPQVEDVRTGNADSNDAMLGINNALGFRPYIAHMNWQMPVERVRAYLDGS
jgi:mycothiol synthase